MLKSIKLLILFSFLSAKLFGQTDQLILETKRFISDMFKLYEPNPIYTQESEKINAIFLKNLKEYPKYQFDTIEYTRLLLENSQNEYEDSQDIFRNLTRRSMIFSIFALSLPKEKSGIYMEFAEKTLMGCNNRINTDLIGFYSGFIMLEFLQKDLNNSLKKTDYDLLTNKFETFIRPFDDEIYKRGIKILKQYKNQ